MSLAGDVPKRVLNTRPGHPQVTALQPGDLILRVRDHAGRVDQPRVPITQRRLIEGAFPCLLR